ncbi:MAG: 1,4-beta-xylanase [Pirellulaceae bacterium]|nr:1,4-beta-xylanase [Pirellulaceae bacterium]
MILRSNHFVRCMTVAACALLLRGVTAQGPSAPSNHRKSEVSDQAKPAKKPPPPFAWVNPLPEKHHTALQHATFRSPSMKVDVGYCILLPPSYAGGDPARRYPVVYYLHGGRPGSESKSHRLADLLSDAMKGKNPVAESIYVFVNGGPVSHYNMPDQPAAQGADVFTQELIPHIDATYRTIAHRDARGLEGFSQGGRGTMRISLRHTELFCSAAAGGGGYETEKRISESGGYENENLKFAQGDNVWDLAQRYVDGKHPQVRWIVYVGTDGFNYENNLQYMAYLDSLGIKYQKVIVPDVDHSAIRIYDEKAKRIMRFHAANFARARRASASE